MNSSFKQLNDMIMFSTIMKFKMINLPQINKRTSVHKMMLIYTNLVIFVLLCLQIPISSLQQQLQQDYTSHQFSCGRLYYRTFHLDQQRNVLFVGAMDNVFKVNLANVNKTNCQDDAIRLEPSEPLKCISKGKSENFECRNHVKVIQPLNKGGDRLYVCGTNAYNPRDYLIYSSNLTVSSDNIYAIGSNAQAECPFDPEDNSTAVFVERGNPSEAPALYTGTTSDSQRTDPLIFRTELYNRTTGQKIHEAKRTTKYDSKWLDKPNFVGSFEIGEYVYFFFRESAVEYINCGKSIYSRVARVCKRDNGSKMGEKVWTTFLKARLNCSLPGEFPYYFDEIQSIYRNPYDQDKFHAVFTTSNNGLSGSAVCTFSLFAIQEAFNGKFKEQQSSTAAWLPVPSYKLNQNEPKPGTCVDDTQALSDHVVNFIRGHPLMDSAVANDNGRPVFYRRDVMFTKVVIDILEIDGIRYTIYFVGTNTGHIYKIVEWNPQQQQQPQSQHDFSAYPSSNFDQQQQSGGGGANWHGPAMNGQQAQSSLVEVIEATVPEPVRALEISARHKSLYVGSDSQLKQINLLNCHQRHDNCLQCIRDPYCGWDRKRLECRHYTPMDPTNLIQDVTGEAPDICHSALKHKDIHVTWGQSVHLPCPFNGFIQETQDLQQLLATQQQRLLQQHQQSISPNSFTSPSVYGQLQQQQPVGQSHGLHQQTGNFVQWYYHRRDSILASAGYPVLQNRDRFILAAEQGLVILNANEPGWYQCRLGNQIIHSYNLIIDTKTCAAPNEIEFKRIYADWCREVERYKSAYRNWHAKQNQCQAYANQMQHQHQQSSVPVQRMQQLNQQQQQQQPVEPWPGSQQSYG